MYVDLSALQFKYFYWKVEHPLNLVIFGSLLHLGLYCTDNSSCSLFSRYKIVRRSLDVY